MRTCFSCVTLLLISACASAPGRSSTDELIAFVEFLAEVHPAPSASAAELEELTAAHHRQESDAVSFERALRQIAAAYGDAHLEIGYRAGAQPTFLPILPKRAGGKVFVDASSEPVPLGTELVSIDGRPIVELLDAAARLTSVDGGGRTEVRRAEAERRFALLGRVVLGARDSYRVMIRLPDGSQQELVLNALGPQGVRGLEVARHSAPYWGRDAASSMPEILPIDEAAVRLRLSSFAVRDAEAFEAKVREAFDSLADGQRLVIDLRGNEGGFRTLGIAVLEHLIDPPFAQWERIQTRVRSIPAKYRDRVRFSMAPESSLTNFPGTERGEVWVFEGDPHAVETPSFAVHRGEVVLLIDDATNSAAIEFAVTLLKHRDGVTVIGTETQGGSRRHCGELPIVYEFETMPFAAIVSLFDVQLVECPRAQDGRGIVPDIEVTYAERDFLERRDPFLTALETLDEPRS